MNYDIIKSGQTYMYDTQQPLYPFGYGLSYTRFAYGPLRLSAPAMNGDGSVTASLQVTNTGQYAGRDVVQLYEHQDHSRVPQPVKKLIAFQNVDLQPGQTRTVRFEVKAADLAFWDVTRSKWVVERSPFELTAGGSSADTAARATVLVNGEVIPPRDLAHATQAQNFDDYSGAVLADQSTASGTVVASTADGQWVSFDTSDLRAHPGTFSAGVASVAGGRITVRLDNPVSGPVIGTVTVPATGGVHSYAPVSAPLSGADGIRNAYLVFSGAVRIDDFSMR
jgi:beta-glucosidase